MKPLLFSKPTRLELSLPSVPRYRYTLDDLHPMMNALKLRAESYNEWALNVNEALEAKINKKKSTWCRKSHKRSASWGLR